MLKDDDRGVRCEPRKHGETMLSSASDAAELPHADPGLQRWIDSSPWGIAVTTGELHVIRHVNPEFCRLAGVSRSELVGRRYSEALVGADVAPQVILDRAFFAEETVTDTVISRSRPGMPDEVLSYSAWPLPDASGRREGVVLEIRATTREMRKGEPGSPGALSEEPAGGISASVVEDQRWAAKIEAANRAKSDFLSLMSHELRTPLAGILGHAEVLEMGAVGPVNALQLDSLARIKQCSAHLLEMIDGILSFARTDQQAEQVECVSVDLCCLARETAAFIQPLATEKGLDLRLSLPERPIDTRTDPKKVRQILINLLSNAIKFTDAGEVTLEMSMGKGVVSFDITDTGIGIESADLSRVFEPFVQAEAVTTRRFGGTGLGLPISRGLVARLGGEVCVRSVPGRGSTFSVHLPVTGVQRQLQA
jgi:signal transduction histidine kinase